jgi:hypothetical protein
VHALRRFDIFYRQANRESSQSIQAAEAKR